MGRIQVVRMRADGMDEVPVTAEHWNPVRPALAADCPGRELRTVERFSAQ